MIIRQRACLEKRVFGKDRMFGKEGVWKIACLEKSDGQLGPFLCQFVNFQRVTFPNSYFSKQQFFL